MACWLGVLRQAAHGVSDALLALASLLTISLEWTTLMLAIRKVSRYMDLPEITPYPGRGERSTLKVSRKMLRRGELSALSPNRQLPAHKDTCVRAVDLWSRCSAEQDSGHQLAAGAVIGRDRIWS